MENLSKNSIEKEQQRILDLYKDISNEELKENLSEYFIPQYNLLLKTESIARFILASYGQIFVYQHSDFKKAYSDMITCAGLRKVKVHYEYGNVEVSMEAIIVRILENKAAVIQSVQENVSNYFGYLGNGVFDKTKRSVDDNGAGAVIRIRELEDLYNKIVDDITITDEDTKGSQEK